MVAADKLAAYGREICRLELRVQQLTEAADRLLKLVADKSQPMDHPTNRALTDAGDVILVNEAALWNLKWVLMAHSPDPSQTSGGSEP